MFSHPGLFLAYTARICRTATCFSAGWLLTQFTTQGACSGDWTAGLIADRVKIPKSLPAGDYVLGWRWDVSAQIMKLWFSLFCSLPPCLSSRSCCRVPRVCSPFALLHQILGLLFILGLRFRVWDCSPDTRVFCLGVCVCVCVKCEETAQIWLNCADVTIVH